MSTWHVETTDGRIAEVLADNIRIDETGALILLRDSPVAIFARNNWIVARQGDSHIAWTRPTAAKPKVRQPFA